MRISGWSSDVCSSDLVIRIATGAQPIAGANADQFLIHFAPYFGLALLAVALAGAGSYTWRAFSLAFASWWIHVYASIQALRRRPSRFVVTPKHGTDGRQRSEEHTSELPSLMRISYAVFCLKKKNKKHPHKKTTNN